MPTPAMDACAPMTLADVEAMRKWGRQFTPDAAPQKTALLTRMGQMPIDDASTLIAWHDALLFWLAYPQTAALQRQCTRLLKQAAHVAHTMCTSVAEEDMPDALIGSGLAWTRTAVTFNYQIASWLAERFPAQARLHAIRGDLADLRQVLGNALPPIEFETVAQPCDTPRELLDALGAQAKGQPLQWLLQTLAYLPCSEAMRQQMYRRLRVYVAIHSGDSLLSRTWLRGVVPRLHYHTTPLQRSENAQALLDKPLGPCLPLTADERQQLLTAARGVLALLGRQTEPISDCNGQGVYAYDLGRGVVIGLFSAAPGSRPPLDSHVGMMLFKNGLPVAYGGGWPFLGVCKIGINIFEPYRGGESHFLFLSVMRAYRHLFGVNRFIVERYQFGRNNPEGIASGAYWFYYRLGFRSMRADLASLAEEEWHKLQTQPGSATTREVLEQFTAVHMELRLPGCPEGYAYCDPADLSKAVTHHVNTRFAGDRVRYLAWAQRRVSKALDLTPQPGSPQASALDALAPVLALAPDLMQWPATRKKACRQWVLAKAKQDERAYFALLTAHPALGKTLETIGLGAR